MSFNESLAKSIAFISKKSINQLIELPEHRFKAYAKKVQKAYYQSKARFENSDCDQPNHREILFQYEYNYSLWSDMKEASKRREKQNKSSI